LRPLGPGQVDGMNLHCRGICLMKLVRGPFKVRSGAGDKVERAAFPGEELGAGATDPFRRSRDEDVPSGEVEVHDEESLATDVV
jgi:hypothetical protein